ncbi:MAG TPA: MFS transporter [Thermodesulfobacteriota bacterium]|nr:MFS transporter [Thermodesulfobacteriota bacterium]
MTTQKILPRDFILSFFAQFAFSCVFCILIPAIPIYLSHFEAKEAEIGFLVGIFSVSSLVIRPFVGRALLRIPEKKFMIAGTAIYVLSCLAYILAPPFWPLLIVRVFHGIGLGLFSTASFTLIANITPESHRGQFVSYFYLSNNLSFALGPFVGMLLINHFSFIVLFLACMGMSLCSFFIVTKLGKHGAAPSQNEPQEAQSFLSREALPSSIIAFMLNIIWGSLSAFFPLYALKHGVSNPGIFFIFLAVTLILGRSLGGRVLDLYDRKKIIMPCLFVIIVSIVILPFSNSLSMFILAAIILGAGWAFLYPSLMIYVMEKAGAAQGPAMATFTALGDLGAGVGPMMMGIILEWTDYPFMFLSLILVGITNLVYFHYAIWKEAKDIRQVVREGKIGLGRNKKPFTQLGCATKR